MADGFDNLGFHAGREKEDLRMRSGKALGIGKYFGLALCLILVMPIEQAAAMVFREDSCGPGTQKDRVSGPAIVGQLKLTDRGRQGGSGLYYLDVEFVSKSASCLGEKLIITNEVPLYLPKVSGIDQIVEKCVDPADICLEGAVFYYNYEDSPISNPAPPSCAPNGWDQVVVSTVLTMDTSLATPYPTLIADVVLLWFNPRCQE